MPKDSPRNPPHDSPKRPNSSTLLKNRVKQKLSQSDLPLSVRAFSAKEADAIASGALQVEGIRSGDVLVPDASGKRYFWVRNARKQGISLIGVRRAGGLIVGGDPALNFVKSAAPTAAMMAAAPFVPMAGVAGAAGRVAPAAGSLLGRAKALIGRHKVLASALGLTAVGAGVQTAMTAGRELEDAKELELLKTELASAQQDVAQARADRAAYLDMVKLLNTEKLKHAEMRDAAAMSRNRALLETRLNLIEAEARAKTAYVPINANSVLEAILRVSSPAPADYGGLLGGGQGR